MPTVGPSGPDLGANGLPATGKEVGSDGTAVPQIVMMKNGANSFKIFYW